MASAEKWEHDILIFQGRMIKYYLQNSLIRRNSRRPAIREYIEISFKWNIADWSWPK